MIGFDRLLLGARQDRVGEAVAVAVLGELAAELVDEQAAVGEDEHALGAGRLDEAGGGDGLAGRGRVAEAIAAGCPGVLGERRLEVVARPPPRVRASRLPRSPPRGRSGRRRPRHPLRAPRRPLPFAAVVLFDRGDQLGEHPGERVDLMAAQLGAGSKMRRLLGEDPLEAEHEREAHLPLGRGLGQPLVDLGERALEGAADRGPGAHARRWLVVGPQEGLSRPGFGSECRGLKAVGRLLDIQRLRQRLVHGCDTNARAASRGRARRYPLASRITTIADRSADSPCYYRLA